MRWSRPLLLVAGILCVILGAVGLFVPLLPTTPFLLLAAWCFARSSEKLHRWLRYSPTFGPILADWEEHGAVRLRVKVAATVLMVALVSYPLATGTFPLWMKVSAAAIVAGVLVFLWTRPNGPRGAGPVRGR